MTDTDDPSKDGDTAEGSTPRRRRRTRRRTETARPEPGEARDAGEAAGEPDAEAAKPARRKKAAAKKKPAATKKKAAAAKKKPAAKAKKKTTAKAKATTTRTKKAAAKKSPAAAKKAATKTKATRKKATAKDAAPAEAPPAVATTGGEETTASAPPAAPPASPTEERETSGRPRRRSRRTRRRSSVETREGEATPVEPVTEAGAEAADEAGATARRRPRRRRSRTRARGLREAQGGTEAVAPEEAREGGGGSGEETARGRRRRRKGRRRRALGDEAGAGAPPADTRAADDRAEEAASDERSAGEVEEVRAPKAPPPEKVLLVNARDPEEVRIALLEDGVVEELYVESAEERSASGNVYRGRVQNVEKAIGAAFVDLGKGLTGFLHVSDVPDRPEKATITDVLQPGQEVLVQITRDSIGRKGPALTGRIALPGRYLVLLATSARSGVSRRIGRGSVRDRARKHLEQLEVPEGMGLIVRTAGEDSTVDDLQRDLDHLLREWERIQALSKQSGPPTLLRTESDVAERSIRDIMPLDTSRIIVDHEPIAARIRTLLGAWYGPIPRRGLPSEVEEEGGRALPKPRPMPEVVVHEGPMPLFHAHDVESQLEQAFRRTVRLPSGGSIVIDPTEALVAIDVNSGRFTAEEDPETTAVATNLEAAKEAARQLRLRDLGGLIVLDLIDMRDRRKERKVEKALKDALARDRARIRVGRIGPFGCLILSRQRVRQALSRVTHAECPECAGTGRRRHPAGLGLRVLREMQARVARAQGRGGLEVRVPRSVKDWMSKQRASLLRDIEASCSGPVRIDADHRLAADGWAMKGLPPTTPRPGADAAPPSGGTGGGDETPPEA